MVAKAAQPRPKQKYTPTRRAKARIKKEMTVEDAVKSLKGAAKARSTKVADEIAAGVRAYLELPHEPLPENATPLDVLVMAMRKAYMLGGSLMAAEYAEKAAPYLHGKISSIELKNGPPPSAEKNKEGPSFRVQFVPPPKDAS